MANMPSASSPRPVWLDDKTKSIMDRAIAREQSLSRLLMTYIITGSNFHAPARHISRCVESHQDQQPRSGGIYLACLDSGTWPCATVRLGGHIHPRHRLLLDTKLRKLKPFALWSAWLTWALWVIWRDRPLVL